LSTYLPLVDQDEGYHAEKASQKIAKLAGSLHESITEGNVEQPSTGHVWAWVLLYLPGMIVGFVGLASLIIQNWSGHSKLHTITYVFSGVMVFFGLVFSLLVSGFGGMWVAPFFWFAVFAGLAALYGDWALGAMVDNLLGMPSGDSSCLYWSYFILKRLTMFSS